MTTTAPDTKPCIACLSDQRGLTPSTAFTAGISFAFLHNNESIKARLCHEHRESMIRGHIATMGNVPPDERRQGLWTSPVATPDDETAAAFHELREVHARHGGHLSIDPTCPFCTGAIT